MQEAPVNINSIDRIRVITIRQIKAARALLGWSQADLARESRISEPTIARLESSEGPLGGRPDTGEKLRTALQNGGIEFLNENDGGPGVRLKKARKKRER